MAKRTRRPPMNKYAVAIAILSSATPLLLGYDLAMVSSMAVLAEADLKLLAFTVVLSSILGALTAVGAQCAIGDRYTVLLSSAVLCAGAIARGFATGSAAFAVGIFIHGVGKGQLLMIVPAYATELSPSSPRGFLASHPDGFVYLGCILGSLCYSIDFFKLPVHLAWRLTVASGTAIPLLLSSTVLLMPESPRWLVAKDQIGKARRVLSRTSATLEEAELRLLEIKAELNAPHGGSEEPPAISATRSYWWKEECAIWLDLLVKPTESLRRTVMSTMVAKVFQQASGIRSMFQYVQQAFRDVGVSSDRQLARALAAFGLVVLMSFFISLVLVELGWLLLTALAGCCLLKRAPPHPPYRGNGGGTSTRRREQLRRARGLSATTLLSLLALVWIALGPAQWADALRAAADTVNNAVSTAIFSSFAWVYEATSVSFAHGGLLLCPAAGVLVWIFFCACLLGARGREARQVRGAPPFPNNTQRLHDLERR